MFYYLCNTHYPLSSICHTHGIGAKIRASTHAGKQSQILFTNLKEIHQWFLSILSLIPQLCLTSWKLTMYIFPSCKWDSYKKKYKKKEGVLYQERQRARGLYTPPRILCGVRVDCSDSAQTLSSPNRFCHPILLVWMCLESTWSPHGVRVNLLGLWAVHMDSPSQVRAQTNYLVYRYKNNGARIELQALGIVNMKYITTAPQQLFVHSNTRAIDARCGCALQSTRW